MSGKMRSNRLDNHVLVRIEEVAYEIIGKVITPWSGFEGIVADVALACLGDYTKDKFSKISKEERKIKYDAQVQEMVELTAKHFGVRESTIYHVRRYPLALIAYAIIKDQRLIATGARCNTYCQGRCTQKYAHEGDHTWEDDEKAKSKA